jgi:hypothetical protein
MRDEYYGERRAADMRPGPLLYGRCVGGQIFKMTMYVRRSRSRSRRASNRRPPHTRRLRLTDDPYGYLYATRVEKVRESRHFEDFPAVVADVRKP